MTKPTLTRLALATAVLALSAHTDANANTLQFNQTLYVASGTVPAGKTWKIENLVVENKPYNYQGGGSSCCACGSTAYGTVTGTCTSYNRLIINGVATDSPQFPIWLPAGATLSTVSRSCGGGAAYLHESDCGTYANPVVTVETKISILEFNVAP